LKFPSAMILKFLSSHKIMSILHRYSSNPTRQSLRLEVRLQLATIVVLIDTSNIMHIQVIDLGLSCCCWYSTHVIWSSDCQYRTRPSTYVWINLVIHLCENKLQYTQLLDRHLFERIILATRAVVHFAPWNPTRTADIFYGHEDGAYCIS